MLKILLILFLSTTTIYAENKNFIKLITDCSEKVQNNYADNQKIPLELMLAQAIIESNWENQGLLLKVTIILGSNMG